MESSLLIYASKISLSNISILLVKIPDIWAECENPDKTLPMFVNNHIFKKDFLTDEVLIDLHFNFKLLRMLIPFKNKKK